MTTDQKPKKVLTPEQLEKLAMAREKAAIMSKPMIVFFKLKNVVAANSTTPSKEHWFVSQILIQSRLNVASQSALTLSCLSLQSYVWSRKSAFSQADVKVVTNFT